MKKALVIGLGVSGKAAAQFLLEKGYSVRGVDRSHELRIQGVEVRGETMNALEGIDFVVISPGISLRHPLCLEAKKQGIELIGELELGARFVKQPCIGITGTNGKTTTTLQICHLLNENGIKAKAIGNIGIPLTEYLRNPDLEEVLVIEVSSFQLETASTPLFDQIAVLNITPDHLDRYDSFDDYVNAKLRMISLVKKGGKAFIHKSISKQFEGTKFTQDIAIELCKYYGIPRAKLEKTLYTFQKPSHRLEFVRKVRGIIFVNDSKATNIEATLYALSQFKKNVILIAGGRHKGGTFAPWKVPAKEKIKCMILYGEARKQIAEEFCHVVKFKKVQTLEQAVSLALKTAKKNDTVLLSPGCASFDQFNHFAHRGDVFKQIVWGLEEL